MLSPSAISGLRARCLLLALLLLAVAPALAGGSFNRVSGSGLAGGGGGAVQGGSGSALAGGETSGGLRGSDETSEARRPAEEAPDAEAEEAETTASEESADPGPAAQDEEAAAGEGVAAPQGEPTLGRACIYGPGGRVLYAPPAKRCAGEAEQGRLQRARTAEPASGEARPRGRCILGADGRVVHAPPGVVCPR